MGGGVSSVILQRLKNHRYECNSKGRLTDTF